MLSGAVIYAKSLDVMTRFYQGIGYQLADQSAEESADFCLLTTGESELYVIQIPDAIAGNIEISKPAELRSSTPIKLMFRVDSIVATAELINALGGRIDRGQARWEMGDYFVQDAVDPEGNILQLREPKNNQS